MEKKKRDSLFNEINEALHEIASRHGVVFEESKAKDKDEKFNLSASFSTIIDGLNRVQREYLNYANDLDLKDDWLFIKMNYKANGYKILGLNIKKYKNPVIVYNLTKHKKEFMHPDQVRKIWGKGIKINHNP